MNNGDHLTDRQREYVRHLASGKPSRDAARAAGFSDSYAKVAAHRLGKNPAVAQAIAAIRKEGMQAAVYDLATAMREAGEDRAFAIAQHNPMAAVKASELRAKLSGLLIDRVEVVTVDLRGSLQRAEARVLNSMSALTQGPPAALLPPPTAKAIRWPARIAGDGESEAGQADGRANN
jgi:hypothetical protein